MAGSNQKKNSVSLLINFKRIISDQHLQMFFCLIFLLLCLGGHNQSVFSFKPNNISSSELKRKLAKNELIYIFRSALKRRDRVQDKVQF